MMDDQADRLEAAVFKYRGTLLALPAALLAACGRPSAYSIAVGLPVAIAGELIRCWAVGYSGVTTRGDVVEAPRLISAGPYAYVRNPLYVGNFITAAGFAYAFTGGNLPASRWALRLGSLAAMAAVYAVIIPHEERFLQAQFGEAFARYRERVPRVVPQLDPMPEGVGEWNPAVIREAESRTFATFAVMLGGLVLRALKV